MPGRDSGSKAIPVVDWLLETSSLREFLRHLVEDAVEVSHADGCGVTLQRGSRPLTVVSTGGTADKLDERQYGQDDGPCLQALRTGEVVYAPDMPGETRWASYPSYAVSLGVRSALSLPVPVGAHTVGALNFYASDTDAFSEADERRLTQFAAQAGGGIALAQRLSDAEEFTHDLQAALQSRAVIDQAIGVVMGRRQCDADQALAILRDLSQQTNTKLRDVCAHLLTDMGGREPQPRPPLQRRP
ncbi:GAF and ANTAR domain-containing protein [Streptomyces sp. 7R007]